jgi:hypothetical protein
MSVSSAPQPSSEGYDPGQKNPGNRQAEQGGELFGRQVAHKRENSPETLMIHFNL